MAKKKAAAGPKNSKVWSIFSLVSTLASAAVARRALDSSWKVATGKKPPANPADPDVSIAEAFLWAAASGTFVAVAKMLTARRAANYYAKSTGHLPPALQADIDAAQEKERA